MPANRKLLVPLTVCPNAQLDKALKKTRRQTLEFLPSMALVLIV